MFHIWKIPAVPGGRFSFERSARPNERIFRGRGFARKERHEMMDSNKNVDWRRDLKLYSSRHGTKYQWRVFPHESSASTSSKDIDKTYTRHFHWSRGQRDYLISSQRATFTFGSLTNHDLFHHHHPLSCFLIVAMIVYCSPHQEQQGLATESTAAIWLSSPVFGLLTLVSTSSGLGTRGYHRGNLAIVRPNY